MPRFWIRTSMSGQDGTERSATMDDLCTSVHIFFCSDIALIFCFFNYFDIHVQCSVSYPVSNFLN